MSYCRVGFINFDLWSFHAWRRANSDIFIRRDYNKLSSNLTHKNFYSNDSSFSIFNSDSRFFQVSLSYFVHRFLYLNFLSINFLTYRNWNERKSKEIGSVYFKPCLCRIHRLIIIVLLKFVSSFVSNFITVNNYFRLSKIVSHIFLYHSLFL